VLVSPAPYLGKSGLARAQAKFDELREDDGKVSETFQILTLTGWRYAFSDDCAAASRAIGTRYGDALT
jgi:hypothetical protein